MTTHRKVSFSRCARRAPASARRSRAIRCANALVRAVAEVGARTVADGWDIHGVLRNQEAFVNPLPLVVDGGDLRIRGRHMRRAAHRTMALAAVPGCEFVKRDVGCRGWCTSPTRCRSQTRSYDFNASPACGAASVLRKSAFCVCALGVAGCTNGVWSAQVDAMTKASSARSSLAICPTHFG
jgi:hypothetical protein